MVVRRICRIGILGSILLVTAAPGTGAEGIPAPTHATVLLYHCFDEPQHPTTNTSGADFRRQMTYLRDHGYTVLPMDAFGEHLEGGTLPPKSVVITIDDPHLSAFHTAKPILEEFGYPYTVFVWTSGVESGYGQLMTWEMIESLAREGVTIANHSHTHPHLALPRPGERRADYTRRVSDEFETAGALLRDHGLATDLAAYPYGEYNDLVIDALRCLGFRLAFTQDPGGVNSETPRMRIPRAVIVGDEITLDEFAFKLTISPLRVEEVRPSYGFLPANPPGLLLLRIATPERYLPGVVNMFLSEWGRVDADYDPETGVIRYVPRAPLTRETNRLIVTAKDRESGTFSMHAQMLVRPCAEAAATDP